jgi:hypothetical protein
VDTEKLLRVLLDILEDEGQTNVAGKMEEVRAAISQNSPDGYTSAQTLLKELSTNVRGDSTSYAFSITEQALLKRVAGDQYFGVGLVTYLDKLYTEPSYQLLPKVDAFREKRANFIQRARQLVDALTSLNINAYRPSSYEVGMILPDEQADANKIQKRVKELDMLLRALEEAASQSVLPTQITRAATGSIELFSLQSAEVALLFSTLLLNVSDIWDKVIQLRKRGKELAKDNISEQAKATIQKVYEEEAEILKREILDELPEKILEAIPKKITDEGRRNEIKIALHGSLKSVFGWFEAGIEVDITPVRLDLEERSALTAKEIKLSQNVGEVNRRLQKIYRLPAADRKLPFALPPARTRAAAKKRAPRRKQAE